ncbi:Chs5p-Arf1p-binding protein (ChAPs) [Galdieria sulphuraria]|uniref:Chs5p-Arf1p-binding protein (ChAPs) n=1 Tax=Galdieria sulphuraria TaxID=130081 RepID=M2VZP2_GALSU|nr:Chs5p-Arf1p-binding protein (ChAPs) [Galdieria sulphuraria]EME28816.1 Chs5p-Arf1p-binding protein (ChAPs) [Galdieria sulphuraria]|eukprot:XP_005705336.1 Chs5p-Arf1p-binding protein (ChAPs) [Galdieria sulphuraria]
MSSDVLHGTPEVIEKGTGGFAAEARQRHLTNFTGLGPPDLVCISKHWRGVVGKGVTQGYFHFVRGIKAESTASISTYLGRLIKHGLEGASWYSGGGYKIVSAACRSYNSFSKCDILVKVDVPGSVSSLALFPDGHEEETSDLIWKETFVCSVLRASEGVGEHPLYPCLVAFQPLDSVSDERSFLTAASEIVSRWPLVGSGRPGLTFGDSPSQVTPATCLVAEALFRYFAQDSRFEQAQKFFETEVGEKDVELKYFACRALKDSGNFSSARSLIDTVVQECPSFSAALLMSSQLYLETGQLDAAFVEAKKAVEVNEKDTLAWIHLANLYVEKGDLVESLIALNSAIMEPPTLDPFLRELLPARKRMTKPLPNTSGGTDIIRVLAKRLHEERIGPATGVDESLAELSATLMTDPEKQAYQVLVKALNKFGWDEILNARSDAFIMEADISHLPEGQESSTEQIHETDVGKMQEAASSSQENAESSSDTAGTKISKGQPSPGKDFTLSAETNGTDGQTKNVATEDNQVQGNDSSSVKEDKVREVGGSSEQRILKNKHASLEVYSSKGHKKKMCTPWLDFLVNNMYEDLRALAIWQAEDEQMAQNLRSTSGTSTSHTSSQPNQASSSGTNSQNETQASQMQNDASYIAQSLDADQIAKQTKRPPVDWLRRGELARRIQRSSDAERAFRIAIILSSKNSGAEKSATVSPWLSLLEMYAEDGFASEALVAADAVWNFMDSHADRISTSSFTPPVPAIRRAVFKLVHKHGLHKIREQVMDKRITINRHRIQSVLLDAVEWKVSGYDR